MAEFLAHLSDPVLLATPVFLLFVAIEILALHVLGHDDNVIGYSVKDTRTSMSMGAVAVVINGVFRIAMLFVFAALHELAPVKFSPYDWWAWVLMLLGQEIVFYAYHRASHRVRIMWAGHQVHHSSEHYNFSTALRQKWTPYFQLPFWSILAFAGIPPWMILTGLSIDLVYQFFVHTEKIRKLPRWFEYVFNTPSHHRVHHGSDQEYLDANYGGILILWDRMFGSFVPEGKRPTYGLTKNVESCNLFRVGFHEYGSILRDVRAAGSWRDKLGYVFGPPGWQPEQALSLNAPAQGG
ncbi:sterol desaturase family protein [Amycolatopsis sp. QT-25]|uniref:sterol desaturase family protein n=1 Tax=Amycolatopsis sp. QT-25 TaxID=3034022 RepID=UPI0023EDDCF9|nr:sterol desaturase family protein [Amycolatopsis sp. QT-25]WET82163.1 sterol desaturase family protein [Amycolatopsis sp. QT-25]